jgi:hypothetical protein
VVSRQHPEDKQSLCDLARSHIASRTAATQGTSARERPAGAFNSIKTREADRCYIKTCTIESRYVVYRAAAY